jgi:hypothetical protein
METGRNSISIEVDPGYVALIEDRLRGSGLVGRIKVNRFSAEPVAAYVTSRV